jgi:hypothetical protein
MLKGRPKLILLDELPPYLENARTIPVGTGDLSMLQQLLSLIYLMQPTGRSFQIF